MKNRIIDTTWEQVGKVLFITLVAFVGGCIVALVVLPMIQS